MPYIDKTGARSGWSLEPQEGLGLVDWVDVAPEPPPPPADAVTLMLQEQQRLIQELQAQVAELQNK